MPRIALGLSYHGSAYQGWQSQPSGQTVQDQLETALHRFTHQTIHTLCAGRTDAGVHALMQVVHFDTALHRPENAWVRGVNTFLPPDIAVQWARSLPEPASLPAAAPAAEAAFHARASARMRRYSYVLLQSPVRPSVEALRVGWVFQPLDGARMRQAASVLLGEHDFSSFRAAGCQSHTPVKTLYGLDIHFHPAATLAPTSGRTPLSCGYWRFDFTANAFLHHMIRNIMGCLIYIGQGSQPVQWMQAVLHARNRDAAAPTFAPHGLYFLGPVYDPRWGLPERVPAFDWLPGPGVPPPPLVAR